MQINWRGKPGDKNGRVEIDHAICGEYYFSLCDNTLLPSTEPRDPTPIRAFVYCEKGWKHLGGFNTVNDAKTAVEQWTDAE